MRTIVLLTQKGGTGKTTLAASLAVAAAQSGERVIALDLDPQASLVHWAERRAAAHAVNRIMVEPLERERLQRLRAILDGLASAGFTLAIFDTAGADGPAVRLITEAADLCLLPARPTRLDMEATAATFRALFLAKRKAAFVLNQCPVTYRSSRAGQAAKGLTELGVLAEPMLATRMDYQDAIAAGLGVTEYDPGGRAAAEIKTLWNWSRAQFGSAKNESKRMPRANQTNSRANAPPSIAQADKRQLQPKSPSGRTGRHHLSRWPQPAAVERKKYVTTAVALKHEAPRGRLVALPSRIEVANHSAQCPKSNRSNRSPIAGELTGMYGFRAMTGSGRLSRLRFVTGCNRQFRSMNFNVET